jgi:N6-L-threonylcarbamoyladenine synthase
VDSCLVLGIETSCDETAAAVVRADRASGRLHVLSSVTASQDELHAPYRGVVPEIASRAHLERIQPVIRRALADSECSLRQLDAVAVGHRPGLIGSLLVGTSAAKAIAWSLGVPVLGVDHVAAHLVAALLDSDPCRFPAIGLVASGGHTSLFSMAGPRTLELLGATIDDAAGEAFDKAAACLGLAYPGGPRLDALASQGDAARAPFPLSRVPGMDFSFSGVKTALREAVAHPPAGCSAADIAAGFREAIVGAIVRGVERALDAHPAQGLIAGGGVCANALLRARLAALCESRGLWMRMPKPEHCTDNAAMIAGAGALRAIAGERDGLDLTAQPLSALARGRRGPKQARAT